MLNWKDRKYVNPRKKVFKNLDTNEILNLEIQDDPDNILEESETPLTAHNLNLAQAELVDEIGTQTQSEREVLTLEQAIQENTEYEIPIKYEVGNNSLEIYYQGTKLIKGIEYLEVGTEGTFSNKIKFHNWGQNVPVGRTIEFIVRGTILTKAITSEETKAQIEIIKAEQTEQNTNIEANANEIEAIKQENALLRSQIPQGQAEGEYITLKDSSNLPFDEFKIEENSKQATRSGRNFLPIIPAQTKTANGITFTSNGDGSYFASGTATKKTNIIFNFDKSFTLPNETLYWHLRNDVISDCTLSLGNSAGGTGSSPTFSAANRIMTSAGLTNLNANFMAIVVAEGITININFTPSIEKTDEITEYEPYGVMPSPEFSSDIRNCGDDVNLFNKDTVVHGFISDTTGNFLASSTRYASDYMEVEQNENYYVTPQDNTNWGAWYDENKNFISGISSYGVVTAPVNAKYMRITIKNDDYLNIMKIQKGTVATPWSPYGCGTINIGKCNKNILDRSKCEENKILAWATGLSATEEKGLASDFIRVYPNQKIVQNYKSQIMFYDKNKSYLGNLANDGETLVKGNGAIKSNYTIPNNSEIFYMRLGFRTSFNNYIDMATADIQVELGEIATAYVEHEEQTHTFPLAEGQVLHKDDYLASDGIHQKRETIIYDGTETWLIVSNSSMSGAAQIYCSNPENIATVKLCSHFIANKQKNGVWSGNYLNFYPAVETGLIDLDTWKAYLAEEYANGTPLTVEYELAQEQIIPYTPEQEKIYNELLNSGTYKNVTHICSLDEIKATFEVKYRKDLETLLGGVANE